MIFSTYITVLVKHCSVEYVELYDTKAADYDRLSSRGKIEIVTSYGWHNTNEGIIEGEVGPVGSLLQYCILLLYSSSLGS